MTIQENANKNAQVLYAQHKGGTLPEETIERFKSGEYARFSEGNPKDRKKEGKLTLKAYAAMAEDARSDVYVHKAHKDNTPRLSLR
ncbi:hypothetical protein XthCFBP4691_13755 [Xanthomonas theicola]|uniref:Uncharacterized protein n=1 Tax=Xanthomonas theicola TaxID=56464 RepID=A0A2S6ZD37_9XANT|nr:hypothetical protein XthCFBP4691_13755 [Xanthomonas theicola]QNH27166.1 hypothetical protein G4Q83_19965 [Xanthomonas theicola]